MAFSPLHPRRKSPPRADACTVDDAIAVLQQAGRLSCAAAHFARGLKDLRNLVHPALERRQRTGVSGRHAELALAALEVLAQELTA
ncbi:MAG: hypothetical protein IPP14_10740 [Planctomycetes bacterium]|nr:hypothetical protein [Planctomycetota bacterium]